MTDTLDALLARLTMNTGLVAYRWVPITRWCPRCGSSGMVPRLARLPGAKPPGERPAPSAPAAPQERLACCPSCKGEGLQVLLTVVPVREVSIDLVAVESLSAGGLPGAGESAGV